MNDHDTFLQLIFKHPDDANTRLVYADWLDEHDQLGGELIRVPHQLTLLDLSKSERAALLARERKLVAACDQD